MMIFIGNIFSLIFIIKSIDSIQIGYIKHASVITNTSLISTTNSNCSDCLCNCLSDENCYGINCFPSNYSCQRIEQTWIQENELFSNLTSDQFINTIDLNFCSYYSSQNILNQYQNITPISITHPMARYIMYNSYDDTLIVLGDELIGQYYVSNLTRFRNWTVSSIPLAVSIDSIHIFISYYTNVSINIYDKNMNFIQSIQRPIKSMISGGLYGLDRWKNLLFISDQELYLIWSINLDDMSMSIYLNLVYYSISPYNIAVSNDHLYITQFSTSSVYIFDLNTFAIQTMTFSSSIPLYRLQKDPYCNRFWFGTNQVDYTSVPVFNTDTNKAQIYQPKGLLAKTTVYIATFDSNYSLYTTAINTNTFSKYQMSNMNCRK